MTTSPQPAGRVSRAPRPRRAPGTTGSTTARKTAIAPEPSTSTDGSLTLIDETGDVIQVTPAPVVESLRYMLARLRLGDGEELPDRLGMTSAIRGEGVTFISRALGLVLGNDAGKRVCIVDVNWWAPSGWPADDSQLGVADIVRDGIEIDQALIATGNPGVHVLPAGSTVPSERPTLARSQEIEKLFVALSEGFDHVIVDLPAVHATSEALTLAENCRAVALVVGQGITSDTQVKKAIEELSGITMLGVILNRSYSKIPRFLRSRIPGV